MPHHLSGKFGTGMSWWSHSGWKSVRALLMLELYTQAVTSVSLYKWWVHTPKKSTKILPHVQLSSDVSMIGSDISLEGSDISLNSNESSLNSLESLCHLYIRLMYPITQLANSFNKSLAVSDNEYVWWTGTFFSSCCKRICKPLIVRLRLSMSHSYQILCC